MGLGLGFKLGRLLAHGLALPGELRAWLGLG